MLGCLKQMKAWGAGLVALLAAIAVLGGAESARAADDIFQVHVTADATAANSTAARDQAFAQAKQIGFDRLVRRLTLPEQLNSAGAPRLEGIALERLINGIDVESERRSGVRYIAVLAVNYDPAGVRALLRGAGLTVVETRAPPVLIAPQLAGLPEGQPDPWRQAWEQGGYAQELAPLAIASAALAGAPNWAAAQPLATAAGAASAVYATARASGSALSATLTEVSASGGLRPMGSVSAMAAPQEQGLTAAYARLASAANDRIQADWKSRASQVTASRTRVAAAASFSSHGQWRQIVNGLKAASGTVLSDVRIESVAKRGAMVSFTYVGSPDALVAALGRNGVAVQVNGGVASLSAS